MHVQENIDIMKSNTEYYISDQHCSVMYMCLCVYRCIPFHLVSLGSILLGSYSPLLHPSVGHLLMLLHHNCQKEIF